jgi:hypothetical protein
MAHDGASPGRTDSYSLCCHRLLHRWPVVSQRDADLKRYLSDSSYHRLEPQCHHPWRGWRYPLCVESVYPEQESLKHKRSNHAMERTADRRMTSQKEELKIKKETTPSVVAPSLILLIDSCVPTYSASRLAHLCRSHPCGSIHSCYSFTLQATRLCYGLPVRSILFR